MKIAMLLPLLPLHAAAEELRKLTTTIDETDETATIKTLADTKLADSADGTTKECGLENTFGTECLFEWETQQFGKETHNMHCVSADHDINCQSCVWCDDVTQTATIKPLADTVNADFIDCTHKNCLEWTCKNWCHCYEEKFDEIYAFEKCVGEDTCDCGEIDNAPINEPLINTDYEQIYYLYVCKNRYELPSEDYTEADVVYMKKMVAENSYQPNCDELLKSNGDTAAGAKVVTAEDTTSTTVSETDDTTVTKTDDTIKTDDTTETKTELK